jgi:thymidylate synthase
MDYYVKLLEHILLNGSNKGEARENMPGTKSVFGYQFQLDVREGFPLLKNKGQRFEDVVVELFWFMLGDNNIGFLLENGNNFWVEDAYNYFHKKYFKIGNTGAQYPYTWRNVPGNDQLIELIKGIRSNPYGRRHIISSMDINNVDELALFWCHSFFQINIDGHYLDLKLYQRSADAFLGVPYNVSTYCLFMYFIANVTGYKPRFFIHSFGDLHIYEPHIDKVIYYIDLEKNLGDYELPTLEVKTELFTDVKTDDRRYFDNWLMDIFKAGVFSVPDYVPGDKITGKLFTGRK